MRPSDLPDLPFDSLLPGAEAHGLPPAEAETRYRAIWISDIHLGTAGCKAEYLLDFLKHHDAETLYLVGDIVDAWQLKRGWYRRQAHNDVVLAYLGDSLYDLILKINHWFNHVRVKLGFPYWSLSQYLKHKAKTVVSFICDFEEALANEARRRSLDGVVCGHIHKAEIRDIGGILYCNDGDWVESLTALVEDYSGALSIVEWNRIAAESDRHHLSISVTQPVAA